MRVPKWVARLLAGDIANGLGRVDPWLRRSTWG
jgi:hypothetical protein